MGSRRTPQSAAWKYHLPVDEEQWGRSGPRIRRCIKSSPSFCFHCGRTQKLHFTRCITAKGILHTVLQYQSTLETGCFQKKITVIFSLVHLQIINFSFYYFKNVLCMGKQNKTTKTKTHKFVTVQKIQSGRSQFPYLSCNTLVRLPRDKHGHGLECPGSVSSHPTGSTLHRPYSGPCFCHLPPSFFDTASAMVQLYCEVFKDLLLDSESVKPKMALFILF